MEAPWALIEAASTPDERERQLIDYIHSIMCILFAELSFMAEEVELLKHQR